VRITNLKTNATETFCDGGVVANHPALLGYTEAVHELSAPPHAVPLLSLSTPRTDLSQPETHNLDLTISRR
jgi:patatin-like phospholipase/acyl hydrolase